MVALRTTPAPTALRILKEREDVRSLVALLLISLVVVEILGFGWIGYYAITHPDGTQTDKVVGFLKDLAGVVLSPSIALASAVMGFYFATAREG
jgi:hypothetical protein